MLFGFEQKTLKECVADISKMRWQDYPEHSYEYIDLSSIDRNSNQVINTQEINKNNAPSRAQQIVCKEDVLFGTTRPMLKRYCIISLKYDRQICSTGFCVLRAKREIVLPKWIFYCISTSNFFSYVQKYEQGTNYPAISDTDVKNYKIPVPSIKVQEYVISLLDKFDMLIGDIQQGLPREIELRQKQYEYYREKLLRFSKMKESSD